MANVQPQNKRLLQASRLWVSSRHPSPQCGSKAGFLEKYQVPREVSPGEPQHKQVHPLPNSFLDLPAALMPRMDAARVTNVSGKKIFICSRNKGTLADVRQELRRLPLRTSVISAIKRVPFARKERDVTCRAKPLLAFICTCPDQCLYLFPKYAREPRRWPRMWPEWFEYHATASDA